MEDKITRENRENLKMAVEEAMGGKIDARPDLGTTKKFDVDNLRESSKEAAKVVRKENEHSNN